MGKVPEGLLDCAWVVECATAVVVVVVVGIGVIDDIVVDRTLWCD